MTSQPEPSVEEQLQSAQALALRYAGELAQIRAALSTVTVYQDLVDTSPVPMMVAELARDHDELESRIEAALLIASGNQVGRFPTDLVYTQMQRIIDLLRGAPRVPDTIEGISGV